MHNEIIRKYNLFKISVFKNTTNESEKTFKEVFNCKDDIESYISNYTAESFIINI